jgi:hypothetical protein
LLQHRLLDRFLAVADIGEGNNAAVAIALGTKLHEPQLATLDK